MSADNLDGLSAAVTDWAVGERLVRRIYLFGSRAKGSARPDSDIDLAILHGIDPAVVGTCDKDQEHLWTWWDHGERWTHELQARLEWRAHVWPVDRESRKIVMPALKECRLCLYRRVSMLLIAAWLATLGQAFGFEVDGYRSGMSLAELQRHAGQLSRITPNSETYVMMTPSGPVGPSFTFCDGRLAMYGLTLDGGFPAFNRILERESTRRGQGEYNWRNDEGRSYQLTYFWHDGDATMTLTLTEFFLSSDGHFGVVQVWDAREAICLTPKP